MKPMLPEDFDNKTSNVYEAIMVVARRARKIAADQKIEIEKSMQRIETPAEENIEEVLTPPDDSNNVYLKLDKPTKIAFEELTRQEIDFEYREKSPNA